MLIETVLFLPFQYVYILNFFFLPIALVRLFSIMLNKWGESRQPCLVPNLKGEILIFGH